MPAPTTIELTGDGPASEGGALLVDTEAFAESVERELLASIEGFELEARLGTGAMGAVWLARDLTLGRRVAIKLVRFELVGSKHAARMRQEARALARLNHENVVGIHEMGRLGSGGTRARPIYIVMEYVEGCTLNEWGREAAPSLEELLAVFVGAGRGLSAAHRAGIVHRDFKPSNVLVDADSSTAKVADFGLARFQRGGDAGVLPRRAPHLPGAEARTRLTRAGAIVGTPAYMAPEQLCGGEATPASDQFAFCVCLWEEVFGRPPWRHETLEELVRDARSQRLIATPPPSSKAPRWLVRLLRRGLSQRPEDRFPSMDALLDELEHRPQRQRRWRWLGTLGVLASALASASVAAGARLEDRRDERDRLAACERGLERLEETWDEAERGALRDAFVAADERGGAGRADLLIGLIDGRVEGWREEGEGLCELATGRALEPRELAITSCIDRRAAELEAILPTLTDEPTPTIMDDAVLIVYESISGSSCREAPQLEGLPVSAAERAEQIETWAEVARLRSRRGRTNPEELRLLIAHVEEADDPVALAHLEVLEAEQYRFMRQPEAELEALRSALRTAGRADEPLLLLRVTSRLVPALAHAKRFEEAQWLVAYSDGIAEEVEARSPYATAVWHNAKATLQFWAQDYAGAERSFAASARIYATLPAGGELALRPSINRATALRRGGRPKQAQTLYLKNLAVLDRYYPTQEHRKVVCYSGLGLLMYMSDTEQARAYFELGVAALGEDRHNPAMALFLRNEAELALSVGDYARALELHEREQALFSPTPHPELEAIASIARLRLEPESTGPGPALDEGAPSLAYLAQAERALDQGRPDAALELLAQAEALNPSSDDAVFDVRAAQARALHARGQLDAARDSLDAALDFLSRRSLAPAPADWRLSTEPVEVPMAVPELQFLAARIEWEGASSEADRREALRIAAAAQRRVEGATPTLGRAQLGAAIESWRAERGEPQSLTYDLADRP